MQPRHGFLHSNKTDHNEPKHHYWVQKCGFGAFVSFLAQNYASFRFWPEIVRRFVNDLNRCIKYNPGMVFCTVTKLTKTNQNITIGSEDVDWVRSFRFSNKTVHRFVNDPNGCIKCNICMFFCTVTKLTKTNQNITIGSKTWTGCVRFVLAR